MSQSINRRQFLGAAAAGFAAGPFIGGTRRAHAARGSAVACIRLWLGGGARSTALWDGKHTTKYNPYGLKYETPPSGLDYHISDLWPDSMLGVLDKIAVVRTLFHGDDIGTNHRACSERNLTGGLDRRLPGWAVVANRELDKTIPSVVVGSSGGLAEKLGGLGPAFSSIVVPNANAVSTIRDTLQAGLPASELDRIRKLRERISLESIRRTPSPIVRNLPLQQALAAGVVEHIKSGSSFDLRATADRERLGAVRKDLIDPASSLVVRPTGERLSNADLRRVFGVDGGGRAGRDGQYAEGAMLAVRLVQSGVRAVTVSAGGWDTHQGEADRLQSKIPMLGQAIVGLITVLDALPPLSGRATSTSALDDVLIVVDSEFSRDNTNDEGFNPDDGSDHRSTYARYFSAMFAGGGINGGKAVGTNDENYEPVDDVKFHASRINATVFDLLGVDASKYLSSDSTPIEELYA